MVSRSGGEDFGSSAASKDARIRVGVSDGGGRACGVAETGAGSFTGESPYGFVICQRFAMLV